MSNLPATRSTLQSEISAITEKLAPAGPDEVGRCLGSLMDAGMMIPASVQADEPVEEYRIALKAVPLHGLRTVFVKLKRGEYDLDSRAFLPLPAEMAAMANAECRMLREDRIRANERIKALDEMKRLPPRPSAPLLKDLRITHRLRADELRKQGYRFVATCNSHEQFSRIGKHREVPAGAIHLWAIDEVWAKPANVAQEEDQSHAA